jgi:hypothetical protein
MSTVRATNFQHPSASEVGIQLGADGSVVFPQGFAGGLGSNVVQTVKTDVFTTTSTSLTDVTGLAATITPTSASSKVLVVASVSQGMREAAGNKAGWTVARGATNLVVPDSLGSRRPVPIYTMHNFTDGSRNVILSTFMFLDSPTTTSATEYKVRAIVEAGTFYLNRSESDTNSAAGSRGVSTLTLIEVAA